MDPEILPLGLAIKLIGGLALCFGALVASAWFLRRRWPGLARLGVPEGRHSTLEVLETRGLAPGSALHLLEVEGTRILVLQSKDRGDVLWTRDGEGGFEFHAQAPAPAPERPASARGTVRPAETPDPAWERALKAVESAAEAKGGVRTAWDEAPVEAAPRESGSGAIGPQGPDLKPEEPKEEDAPRDAVPDPGVGLEAARPGRVRARASAPERRGPARTPRAVKRASTAPSRRRASLRSGPKLRRRSAAKPRPARRTSGLKSPRRPQGAARRAPRRAGRPVRGASRSAAARRSGVLHPWSAARRRAFKLILARRRAARLRAARRRATLRRTAPGPARAARTAAFRGALRRHPAPRRGVRTRR